MKANNLRIGNWVKYEDKLVQVVQLSSLMILCQRDENQFLVNCAPKEFQPIELTEELLVNLFGKPRTNGNKFDIYTIPTNGIEIQDRRKLALPTPTICILKFGVHICDIEYLHQLQNAYYCLTNKELEVEL